MKILEKYYFENQFGQKTYQGTYFLQFKVSKYFFFNWFTDCGDWFIYIYIIKMWFRFGSCGYLSGKNYSDVI